MHQTMLKTIMPMMGILAVFVGLLLVSLSLTENKYTEKIIKPIGITVSSIGVIMFVTGVYQNG